ncbi:hypothetical protein HNV11_18705 [Spirosoma taeanense]|uniref:PKD domain-containing protein n=1 Tax=Spirosoma taeanense TaxID=2735870 RepID=A0A6M5YD89_9BACT|nr:REJ domain-containing protein [Spirosoma taeanense]QJW91260.1 hypothetical protein HNV11_18705 [Spirosoma taeanense]
MQPRLLLQLGSIRLSVWMQSHPAALLLKVAFLCLIFSSCNKENKPPRQPPVAKVTSVTQTAVLNKAVVLDASTSSDPQQKSLTYTWTIKTKPADSKAVITNPNNMVAEFTPDKPGIYVLVLTVTNSDGQTSSMEVTITVALPGSPPNVNAGVSTTVSTGRKVTLDGSKSSDPDGDRLTYNWTIKAKPTGSNPTLANADKAVAELTPDGLGTYVMTLTVSDGVWPAVTADVTVTVTVPVVRVTTGSWTVADGTGGGNDYTPRNHFYTFEVVTNNQPVSLTLTSPDINVGLYVYNPNGEEIGRSGFGRNQTEDVIVNSGKYKIMVCSGRRYDIGAYTLKGRGLSADFVRVAALRAKATEVTFGPEGGGGNEYTPRNHYYTFDVVADNSYTDLDIQSGETTLWMTLFGPSGAEVRYSGVGTPNHLNEKLNKGTYGFWLGSGRRDAISKYTLDIFGQVQNLKQYVFESSILKDEYRGKNAATTYTLNVTDNNTLIDVSLRSPDIRGYFNVYNPNGEEIGYSGSGNYVALIRATTKGQYKIVVTPLDSGIGKYTLSVYGRFSDLKKQ